MAQIDHDISWWIKNNPITILCIVGAIVIIYLYGKDFRHRYFAWLMKQMTKKKMKEYEGLKKDFFHSMNSIVSNNPDLRKHNSIKILEVGVGTGVNFEHYPSNSHLVVVDMNPHFKKYYDENRAKFPNIASEEIIVSPGEEMDMVPDNSIDVVVVTLVLCSVQDIKKVATQIHRVLSPGGKFYFMEHIREWDGANHWFRQMLHDFLSKSGIWPFAFDGCHLNRDMLSDIESVGFSDVNANRIHIKNKSLFLKMIEPHLLGVATK